ncbi:MAG: C_GCAxxG_C_C family protein [Dehalococcoidia bacterium]|nr:C_GCAxxG_C_C family protein [Dehalococcoidia bacterium]
MAQESSKEELLDKIEKTAHDYEAKYHGCSRCVTQSLVDHLKIGDTSTFKASIPLCAGVAMRGETCGALLSGILAVGIALGKEDIKDEDWMGALAAGYRLSRRFEKEIGSTSCKEIQKARLGRAFNIADVNDYEEFKKAGGYVECPKVVGKAARLAAQLIIEESEKK